LRESTKGGAVAVDDVVVDAPACVVVDCVDVVVPPGCVIGRAVSLASKTVLN
jgi:hypothetical protein